MNVNVSINSLKAQVCITCELTDTTSTTGCYVEVSDYHNKNPTTILKITAEDGSSFAVDCILSLPNGQYELMVFDLDNNGSVSACPSFVFPNVSLDKIGLPK